MSTSNTNTDPWLVFTPAASTSANTPLNVGFAQVGGGGPWVAQTYPYHMTSTGTSFTTTQAPSRPTPWLVTDVALNEDGLIFDMGGLKALVLPKDLIKRLATLCTMAQLAGLVEADDAAK